MRTSHQSFLPGHSFRFFKQVFINMQAQGYIQSVGYDVQRFWEETDALAHEHGMDNNLAYMYKMVIEAEGNLILNRKTLMEYGSKVKVFPGVEEWFGRIHEYGG